MLSENQVKYIAKLAKLELTSSEVKKMQKDLSSILDYFEKLEEVDTKEVSPTFYSTASENVMREDESNGEKKERKEKMLQQAPAREKNLVKVKQILKS